MSDKSKTYLFIVNDVAWYGSERPYNASAPGVGPGQTAGSPGADFPDRRRRELCAGRSEDAGRLLQRRAYVEVHRPPW